MVHVPIPLSHHFYFVSPSTQRYEQRDAHEFLSDLVDFLHDELTDSSKLTSTTTAKRNQEDLPTDEYFQLNVRVRLKCDSCGHCRSKDEMYRHLSVDVGEDSDTWTVEKGLKQFFQPEKREVKCEKCQSGTTATQTMEVLSR